MEENRYTESLETYFRLKNAYDTKIRNRNMKKKFVTKCIQCNKNGGTIFSFKKNTYSAICNATPKCDLHIELYRGEYIPILDTISEITNYIEIIKDEITKLNLDQRYGYRTATEVVSVAKERTDELVASKTFLMQLLDLYNDAHNNKAKQSEKEHIITEINEIIYDIRKVVNTSNTNTNTVPTVVDINSVVKLQIDKLFPLYKKVSTITHPVNYVSIQQQLITDEYKKDTWISTLVQRDATLLQDEYNKRNIPSVKSWKYNNETV